MTDYTIEGDAVGPLVDETRNWQELVLTFRADEATRNNTLKPLDSAAGEYDIIEENGGDYTVEDRSNGSAAVSLTPPASRQPPRSKTSFYLDDYSETMKGVRGEAYEVELSLVADGSKASGSHGTTSAGSAEWHFAFADGEIATHRVRGEVQKGGSSVGRKTTLTLTLQNSEVAVVEDSLNRQAATRIREVPDAANVAEDQNDNSRNTVTVTSPSGKDPNEVVIETGTYVVVNWETQLINDAWSKMEIEFVPT